MKFIFRKMIEMFDLNYRITNLKNNTLKTFGKMTHL